MDPYGAINAKYIMEFVDMYVIHLGSLVDTSSIIIVLQQCSIQIFYYYHPKNTQDSLFLVVIYQVVLIPFLCIDSIPSNLIKSHFFMVNL